MRRAGPSRSIARKLWPKPAAAAASSVYGSVIDRPFFDRRAETIRRRVPGLLRHLAVNQPGIDGVREQDDVAGPLHRLGEIAIGPLRR